tara:strand:+ start:614 stop:778 length:165 start_codon:yes stop_codon:yes gene_type:complete
MFYEVTVLNTKTKKKKIISTKELSRRHWAVFEESHNGYASKKENKKVLSVIGKN